ncbi:MAG TPA: AraC family transcriptional regulator [Casimicrobiaceae bacterium]|nr:AraC family transcriptional regulator [Casimicrobiaceae bacterium]
MNRTHHAPHEVLARHQHAHGFAAVVLTGRYAEAGDTGCHRVEAGDVLVHRAFESHVDRFDDAGADVLVVPLPAGWNGPVLGRVADADAVARTAERNEGAVARLLASATTPRASPVQDWPDLLARALRDDPGLSLGAWAAARRLHAGSLSRGFRQVFGCTPARFRLVARAHLAVRALQQTPAPLGDIASACGFADQAHMTRAVRALCGTPPAGLRTPAAATCEP